MLNLLHDMLQTAVAAVYHHSFHTCGTASTMLSAICCEDTCAVCSWYPHPLGLTQRCIYELSNPKTKCDHGRYDDEWGDLRMVVGDHIGYRFEILSRLGKGSFGQVATLHFCRPASTCIPATAALVLTASPNLVSGLNPPTNGIYLLCCVCYAVETLFRCLGIARVVHQ